jgi:hypothetical protein
LSHNSNAMHAPDLDPTPEELRGSALFEFYGVVRVYGPGALAAMAMVLLVQAAAHGWAMLRRGPVDGAGVGAAGWPSPAWTAAEAAVFALPAVPILLLPLVPGPALWPMSKSWSESDFGLIYLDWLSWTFFWIFWTWALSLHMFSRLRERMLPAASPPAGVEAAAPFWRREFSAPRLARGGLALAALLGLAASVAGVVNLPVWPPAVAAWLFTFMAICAWTPAYARDQKNVCPAIKRARARQALASTAGGLILWHGVFLWVAGREARYADREAVFLPDLIDGRVTIGAPMEARRTERLRQHAARVLADEE